MSRGTASMTNSEASDGSFLQMFAAVDNATLYSTNMPTTGTGVSGSKQRTAHSHRGGSGSRVPEPQWRRSRDTTGQPSAPQHADTRSGAPGRSS